MYGGGCLCQASQIECQVKLSVKSQGAIPNPESMKTYDTPDFGLRAEFA